MSTRETTRRAAPGPDLDAEEEVDLGRYWSTIVARWWLPLLGLIGGAAVGYLLALGGGGVYVAKSTAYLGVPFSPTGNTAIQSPNTSPRTVNVLIHSEAAISQAASRCGLRPGQLRGGISSSAAAGGAALGTAAKGTTAQYVTLSVKGKASRKTRCAADSIAGFLVANVSGYVNTKITGFERELSGIDAALASNAARTQALNAAVKNASGLSALDKLVLVSQADNAEQRRSQLLDSQTTTRQLLALANTVEKPRVLARATVAKTTARSKRNSSVVGAFLGLLLGIAAALLWDRFPGAAVARRPGL
jgi:hypothetical protein